LGTERAPSVDAASGADPASRGIVTERVARAMAAESCADVAKIYDESVATEALCDADGGADQCRVMVPLSLACGCTAAVNDATESNAIAAVWTKRGCTPRACCCGGGCALVHSLDPCVANAAGVGQCVDRGP
jgi:hypothetical protein